MPPNLQAIVGHALQDDQDHVFDVETLCCLPPEDGALQGLSNGGHAEELPPSIASQYRRHCSGTAGYTSCPSWTTRGVCSPRWSCSTLPTTPGSWMSSPQLHHSQSMLTQLRISHKMLELRNSQSHNKILEVFIVHYQTKDLVNREFVSKPTDVATNISRKYGCPIAEDDDVARADVNSSCSQSIKKKMRCTTTRFLLPGSYFMFIKKQTRCTTTRFLLPGSYFMFIKKQMSRQSSLQMDDRQALGEDCKDATEKHSERGESLTKRAHVHCRGGFISVLYPNFGHQLTYNCSVWSSTSW